MDDGERMSMQDNQHETDNQTGRLDDGRSYRITDTHVEVLRDSKHVIMRVPIKEIAAVSRGGRDVLVTRREADPIQLRGATVEDARRLADAIRQALGGPTRRHWPF